MKASIRPSTPDDAPQIAALLSAVFSFGLDSPAVDPHLMRWKYWQEHDGWRGSRSYVLARGDDVLAHGAIVPGTCAYGASRFGVIHLIDWAARPGVPGAGLAIMRHAASLTDVLVAVGGSAQTLSMLPAIGFKPHGAATHYVRALRPMRGLLAATGVGRRALPRLVSTGLQAFATSRFRVGRGWTSRTVPRAEVRAANLPLPKPAADLAVLERSPGFFEYVLDCPAVRMSLHAVERDGTVRGYFVLSVANGHARLADCWMDSVAPADWRALIELAALETRRHGGLGSLVALANDPLLSRGLVECGFVPVRTDPVQVMTTRELPDPPPALRMQMLDNDFAWL
jgi:hypothetical protein